MPRLLTQTVACKLVRSTDLRYRNAKCRRFCGQDEYHDPGEDFEENLACAVCGDNGTFNFLYILRFGVSGVLT